MQTVSGTPAQLKRSTFDAPFSTDDLETSAEFFLTNNPTELQRLRSRHEEFRVDCLNYIRQGSAVTQAE